MLFCMNKNSKLVGFDSGCHWNYHDETQYISMDIFMSLHLGTGGIMFSGCLSVCPSVHLPEAQNTIFLAVQGSVGPSYQMWPFLSSNRGEWALAGLDLPSVCHSFPTLTAKPFFALISYLVETFLMGSPGLYNTYSYSTDSLSVSGLIITQAVLTYIQKKHPPDFFLLKLGRGNHGAALAKLTWFLSI